MHQVHIQQCTIQNRNVHISVLNGLLWDMEQLHCGIYELGQLNRILEIRCPCAALCVDWSRHKKFTILHLNHRSVVSLYFGKQPTFG